MSHSRPNEESELFELTPLQKSLVQGLINFDGNNDSAKLKSAIWRIMLDKYPFTAIEKNQGLENQIKERSSVLFYESKGAFKDYIFNARAYLVNNRYETAIRYLILAEKQKTRAEAMGFRSDTEFSLIDIQGGNIELIEEMEHERIVLPLLERLSNEVKLLTEMELERINGRKALNLFFASVPDMTPIQKSLECQVENASELQHSLRNGMVGF